MTLRSMTTLQLKHNVRTFILNRYFEEGLKHPSKLSLEIYKEPAGGPVVCDFTLTDDANNVIKHLTIDLETFQLMMKLYTLGFAH